MIAMMPSPKWTRIFTKVLINLPKVLVRGRGSTAGEGNLPTFIANLIKMIEFKNIRIYTADEPRLEALGREILGSKTKGMTAAKVIHWALNTLSNSQPETKKEVKSGK